MPAGFDEFVRSRGDDLRHFAFLITGDRRSAEALVERSLAKCLAQWSDIEKHSDPYARARELVASGHGSRRWVRSPALQDEAPDAIDLTETAAGGIARDELRAGLAMLRGVERTVVVLHVFEDLSVAETADALDKSERVVGKHLTRALARVRSEAAGPGPGPGDRVAQVHRLLRTRRRRSLEAAAAAVAAMAVVAAVVVHDNRPGSTPAAVGAAAAAASSAPTRTFAPFHLASISTVPAPVKGGLVLQPGGPGHTQLWVYTADDLRPVRALGQLYDRGQHVGPAALDPSDPDRVVYVRAWNLNAVCSAPPCPTPAGSDDGQLIWRLYDMRPSTGKETALTPAVTGQGPDRVVISPDGWRIALVKGAEVDIINTLNNQGAPAHVSLKSEFVQVLGFLADGGPLVVMETSTFYPGVVWASRQWVSAIDPVDHSQQQILYDSDVANCNPTSDVWLLPTDQLVLQTRCGPRPGAMTNGRPTLPEQGVARIYVADAVGAHLIASSAWGPAFRHDLQLDSTGTALLDEFEATTGGQLLVDRVTLAGQRTRVAGAANPQFSTHER